MSTRGINERRVKALEKQHLDLPVCAEASNRSPTRALRPAIEVPATSSRWMLYPSAGFAVVALLLTFLFGWGSLHGYFLGDDFAYVSRFSSFAWKDWPSLFLNDWSGGMWGYRLPELRPIAALSFLIDHALWQVDPFGYRLTNLVVQAVAATLVGVLARQYGAKHYAAYAATLLFCVHPAHVEPLAWVTGRVDSLATCFYLGVLVCHAQYRQTGSYRWLALSWAAYVPGLFSKEFVLTAPLIAGLLDFGFHRFDARIRRAYWLFPYAGWLAAAAAYLACRHAAFGSTAGAGLPPLVSIIHRQIAYLGFLVPPVDAFLAPGAGLPKRAILLVAAIFVLALAVAWFCRRAGWKHPAVRLVLLFGPGWYLISATPLVVVSYLSARHTYLATAGLCIALALLWQQLLRPKYAWPLLVLVAVIWGCQLHERLESYSRAGLASRAFLAEVQVAAKDPRATLVLDSDPFFSRDVWFWAWSAPFALRPPFTPHDLTENRIVLTHPAAYFAPERWHEQVARAAVDDPQVPIWLVTMDRGAAPRRRQISATSYQVGLETLRTQTGLSENEAWHAFVASLPQ